MLNVNHIEKQQTFVVNIITPILKMRKQKLSGFSVSHNWNTRPEPGLVWLQDNQASSVTQPERGPSCRRSDYTWGAGSRLLWGLCFPSFQHWLGQIERCTYVQGRLRLNITLCWLLGRCLFKESGNRCVGPDSITWWRGTHWSMAIFKERCWLC